LELPALFISSRICFGVRQPFRTVAAWHGDCTKSNAPRRPSTQCPVFAKSRRNRRRFV